MTRCFLSCFFCLFFFFALFLRLFGAEIEIENSDLLPPSFGGRVEVESDLRLLQLYLVFALSKYLYNIETHS